MEDDQQFCLRWNNHQSTLVAVFDTLLENGTLVDCTLAAEGKCLNAHKVVLSACSPFFESLLSRHYDKHPILILKDVKFQELKAMMDYMYRGEVNISQDQLGALLKAAESLQIKGLSDNRKGGETDRKPAPPPAPSKSPQPTSLPKVQGLTIEQRNRDDSREGSQSPGPRKKKRIRRKSEELDNHHDASNSSESHSNQTPAQNIPTMLPASKIIADVPEPVETKSEILTRHKQSDDVPQVPIIKEKIETHTELMLEPKSEYVEEMNEDSIEDLTLDDDDISNMESMDDGAGPSHGNAGEGSSQGFGGWHMGNQSQDEVFLAAQEAVGAHRDSQGQAKISTGATKPYIKILAVEDLKNDTIVANIKKELSPHILFGKKDQPKLKKILIEEINLKEVKVEKVEESASKEKKKFPKIQKLSVERMKRFLAMSQETMPPPLKKTFACERDISLIKFPVDTLRCQHCELLYERAKHSEHLSQCKKLPPKVKFGCTSCPFVNASIAEVQNHIKSIHRT
ncbi:longitudinals lacking protein, isoforms H/M/V isoform X1 [Tribolium madens]|uniref:longitudinals lacking protein, isoforms H/M/V isoform X1 n=1 Tax=Tribolium madens TaxID=41895 RepID=UPI001CF751B8|nr:longitudinals lacking protein, isoforms H/M/V isoform X1 [Tribolium madens]